jgi:hypothetical protein
LNDAAIDAACRRKYYPAMKDGVAVPFEMELTIQFKMKQ